MQMPDLIAAEIARRMGVPRHDVAIVLGSGWRSAVEVFGPGWRTMPVSDVPGLIPPSAAGHGGEIRSVRVGEQNVLIFLGRVHQYEGHTPEQVALPVQAACAAGAKTVILTNAAGGIRRGMSVGECVLISDHINLLGGSPLAGPQFIDLTEAYSKRLRELARTIDPTLAEGVYAGMRGPQYETPAEIRMLLTIGADLVGMSTVYETIAARAAGAEVLGISLVTNLAAGLGDSGLDHSEVLAAGRDNADRLGELLHSIVGSL
ncbi:MAG: purine-nucleoside phosphorylase [Nocardiaceae bacterium]|nr:purine-nucleoside phosphorylase [Nocardiaceae bacterium]